MKHNPLNNRLLEEFPYIKEHFKEYGNGAFDMDVPAASLYEGAFVPYLEQMVKENNEKEVFHCTYFLEELISGKEEESILAVSAILTPLYERKVLDLEKLPLGEKSLNYYLEWLK
jgi:hypothetical protein